jgi:hypothetical protein
VLPLGTNYEEQTQEVEIAGIGVLGRPIADNLHKDFYLRVRKDNSDNATITKAIFVQDVPDDARKIFDKALSDFEANKQEIGMQGLEKALAIFPTFYEALENWG